MSMSTPKVETPPVEKADFTPLELAELAGEDIIEELVEIRKNHGTAEQMASGVLHRAIDLVLELVTRSRGSARRPEEQPAQNAPTTSPATGSTAP